MTTPAQLSAQIVDLLTRWNAQQDQLSDWLTGDPAGGPNSDGRYPLTNAEGETQLFLSLPAVINQVTGPASAAASARDAANLASSLAQAAKVAAEAARDVAVTAQLSAEAIRGDVTVQQADVAAKWSDVDVWHSSIGNLNDEVEYHVALSEGIYDQTEANLVLAEGVYDQLRADSTATYNLTVTARVAAEQARDAAQGFANAINPTQLATKAELQTALNALVDAAPGTLDTLNEIAAALGDDPNFATTVTTQLAGKAELSHTHAIAQVTGLQTALDGKAGLSHAHSIANITGLQTALDGKQAAGSYALSVHTHAISEVTGLQTALDARMLRTGGTFTGGIEVSQGGNVATLTGDGSLELLRAPANGGGPYIDFKDNSSEDFDVRIQAVGTVLNIAASAVNVGGSAVSVAGHTHSIGEVSGLQSALDGKAAGFHTHAIMDITGLQGALDGKFNTGGGVINGFLDLNSSQLIRGDANGYVLFAPKSGTSPFGADYDRFDIRVDPINPVTFVGNWHGGTGAARDLAFSAGSGERMRIFSTGAVSIPSSTLTVGGRNILNDIDSKAAGFHTHAISDVTGLQTALDDKLIATGANRGTVFLDNLLLQGNGTHGYLRTQNAGGNLYLGSNEVNRVTINTAGMALTGAHTNTVAGVNQSLQTWVAALGTNTRSVVFRGPTADSASQPFVWSTGNSFAWEIDGVFRLEVGSNGAVSIPSSTLTVGGRNILNDIDSKASGFHTHAISDVTGLQTALSDKMAISNGTLWGRFSLDQGFNLATTHNLGARVNTGWYQSDSGTTAEGWPKNDNSWQYAMSMTHTNDTNYFAFQLGGSFFEQEFYARNTNDNGAQAWSRLWTSSNFDPNGKANSAHTHVISDVTNLQSSLDGKLGRATDQWITSAEGAERFWFSAAGTTFYRGFGHEWRNQGDTASMSLSNDGNLTINGNTHRMVGTSPTLWWQDTNDRAFGIHVNSDVAYFMRGGTNLPDWNPSGTINGRWPMELNLNTGQLTLAAGIDCRSTLFVRAQGGTEGGEIRLEKGPTSALSGDMIFDLEGTSARFFLDNGTTYPMFRMDFASGALFNPAGHAMWHSGNFDPASKADTTHTHSIGQVSGLQAALDGKSATSHTHAVADVTGLAATLEDLELRIVALESGVNGF